ncbi:hypothetical protein FB451DRAFT_951940, partial [Mycena latifolia]
AGGFQILTTGDLNARTASRTASVHDPVRKLDDKALTTRGKFLFKVCTDYDLIILNGVERFGPISGQFTSFQGSRKTVIDYALCSKSLYPKITAFSVEPRIKDFDHAALTLQVEIDPALIGVSARRTR